MTIGERVKARRIELGLSQDDLAKKTGYKSRSSINKIELSRNIPLDKITLFANALECTPGYLAGWSDEAQEVIDHVKSSIVNINSVDPLDRVRKKAESDSAYKDCIVAILNLKPEIQQEIYDYVDFKACKHKEGKLSDSRQVV